MPGESASISLPAPHPRNGKMRGLPVFLLALLVGVGVHVGGLILLNIGLVPAHAIAPPAPFIHFSPPNDDEQREVAREQQLLLDPTPLYLPTPLNFAAQTPPKPALRAQSIFQPYPQQVTLPAQDFHPTAAALTPDSSLQPQQWNLLATLGQNSSANTTLQARGIHLKVTRLGSNAPATEKDWPQSQAPHAVAALWGPATFLLKFGPNGLIGDPFLQNTSGVDSVDKDLGNKLLLEYSRHPLSPPGMYEIVIGQ